LGIYPGGDDTSKEGLIAVYLFNESPTEVLAECEISIITSYGDIFETIAESDAHFGEKIRVLNGWGSDNFENCEEILDADNEIRTNGTLTFVVSIKPESKYYCQTQQQPTLGSSKITK
jgi:hypothetical protein